MRIISKTHDYYDCLQGSDQDRSIIYMRETRVGGLKKGPQYRYGTEYRRVTHYFDLRISSGVVLFCGKIHPVLIVTVYDPRLKEKLVLRDQYEAGDFIYYCYGVADFDAIVAKHCNAKEQEAYSKKDWRDAPHGYQTFPRQATINSFFKDAMRDKTLADWNTEKRCPIIFVSFDVYLRTPSYEIPRDLKYSDYDGWIISNPCLKDLSFMRIYDPASAYQELAMFMANQAAPEKVMPNIPDDMKAHTKGFDKFSFRKPPTAKR